MASRKKREPDELHQKASYLPDIHRLLPQSPDAERGTICSFLLAPNEIGAMTTEKGITAAHFHLPAYATIYGMLREFWKDNEPIDFITITEVLRDRGQLDQVGGAAAVTELFTFLPTAANAGYYVEILQEKYTLREIIKTCTEYAARAYDEQNDVPKLLSGATDALLKIVSMTEGGRTHARDMRELAQRAVDRIQAALDGDGQIDMPTGIYDLDVLTGGFRAPEVTVICGKPSDGKTAYALNVVENLAINHGKRCGIISLEMSDDQCADRLLAAMSRQDIRSIKRERKLSQEQADQIAAAAKNLGHAPIYIRDDGQLTISEIGATFAAWKAKHGLDFGVIDHAQLARGDGKTSGRTEEVEQISRALKPLAKRLGIPLLVLSQVSEDSGGNFRTKNSMALTEDCDNLLTISHKHTEKGLESHIHISKQRDGERGRSVAVNFHPAHQRFSGFSPKETQKTLFPNT